MDFAPANIPPSKGRGDLINIIIWIEFGLALAIVSARLYTGIYLVGAVKLDTYVVCIALVSSCTRYNALFDLNISNRK